jgi:hypothetical protein
MRLGCGEETAGRVSLSGAGPFDALLMSRLDVELRVLEVPPVPKKDLEGLIRLRLRSVYPGNPRETAFDYRLVRHGKTRRAVVFVSQKATVEAYRAAAERRPLVLPYQLISARVPRRGQFRAWFCHEKWAELLVYRDGMLVSSTVRRRTRGKRFDLETEEGRLPAESRTAPFIVVAPAEELERMASIEGAVYLPLESAHAGHGRPDSLFPPAGRKTFLPAAVRTGLLSAAVLVLGLLLLFKYVRQAENRSGCLADLADSLEKGNRESLALQQELDALLAERERLDAEKPRDLYLLLSELSGVLGDAARIRSITVRDDGFQLDATGNNPLRLMEGFKARGAFSDMKLSQVVPDADSLRERFSISGVFHGR